ncbi:hypothetical protein Cfor_04746, partial [Coptotermes formosanus]
FHLSVALKDAIRGKRFGSDEEVIGEVKKWLRVKNSNWYKKGIDARVSRWRKALKVYGHYVEK